MGSHPHTESESARQSPRGLARIAAALARATGRRGFLSALSLLQWAGVGSPLRWPLVRVWGRSPRMAYTGLLAAATLGLAGCAAGLTPTGGTVVGFEVGQEATTLQRAGELAQS